MQLKTLFSKFKFTKFRSNIAILDNRFLFIVLINSISYIYIYIYQDYILNNLGDTKTFALIFDNFYRHILRIFLFYFFIFYTFSLFLSVRFYKIVENIVVVLTILFGCINIFLNIKFYTQLSPLMIRVFFETNANETQEFMQTYFTINVIIPIFLFIILSILATYRIYFAWKLNVKVAMILYLVSFCVICHAAIIHGNIYFQSRFIERNMLANAFINLTTITAHHQEFANYADSRKDLNKFLESKLDDKHKSYITKNSLKLPKIVLIIGESTQRNYMSLYGYPIKTTPFLDRLKEQGNLFVFSDVISPNSHTDIVLSKVLTFSDYENLQPPNAVAWFEQMNLVDTMKLAGYKTIWLSNQEAVSVWGKSTQAISRQSDVVYFMDIQTMNGSTRLDGLLLNAFDTKAPKQDKDSQAFYVFHLMGTHMSYDSRYPESFNIFNAKTLKENHLDSMQGITLNDKELSLKATYLNAILYNDYIVNEIIKRFSDEDSIVFYLSDHGDELYDFRDFVGHTDTIISRYMVEIPFMIYLSDSFQAKYPEIVDRIKNAENLPFMSDDFIHSFLDIVGIETLDSIPSKSMFHESYNAQRTRITAGKDYDKELK